MIFSKRLLGGLLLLTGLVLSGCASTFDADVARFHRLGPPTGKTVTIVAIDPAKVGSLEFEQYAGLVRARLMDMGYQPVSENADLQVELDWMVSEGREKIFSRPGYYDPYPYYHSRFYHPFGFHPRFYGSGFYGHGFYGAYGYRGNDVYSVTVYSVRMTMAMVNRDDEVMFEGRTDSVVRDPDMPSVMPYLVQAMFTDFPGQSGLTRTVEIEMAKGSKAGY
jgi:hypothetical protein